MRFDRPGEALLAAYSEGVLAAIGGITIDPIVPDALRMRRFYVRPAFRRAGIGSEIAHLLLEGALQRVQVVTLNAAVESVPFWEALGFVPQARDGHTHIWRQPVRNVDLVQPRGIGYSPRLLSFRTSRGPFSASLNPLHTAEVLATNNVFVGPFRRKPIAW